MRLTQMAHEFLGFGAQTVDDDDNFLRVVGGKYAYEALDHGHPVERNEGFGSGDAFFGKARAFAGGDDGKFHAKGEMKWTRAARRSEDDARHETNAPTGGARVVEIGEAAHVVDVEELENVVNTESGFDIRHLRIHHLALLAERTVGVELAGEVIEVGARLVFFQIGIVLVGESSPKDVEAHVLAPFQAIEERNAVENLSVHAPVEHQLRIAVVEELHIVDKVVHVVVIHISQVGTGHDQEREGDAIPLRAGGKIEVHATPRTEPHAFAHTHLGEVVSVVAPQAAQSRHVRNAVDGGFLVDQDAALLGVDVGHAGLVLQQNGEIGGAQVAEVATVEARTVGRPVGARIVVPLCVVVHAVGHGLVEEQIGRFGHVVPHLRAPLQAVIPFLVVNEFETPRIVHVFHRRPLECHEHIVLVGRQVLVARHRHVVGVSKGEVRHRELHGQIGFAAERIGQFAQAFPATIAKTVSQIAAPEHVRIEVGGGLQRGAQAQSVDRVRSDGCVYRADVDFRRIFGVDRGRNVVFDQRLARPNHGREAFYIIDAFDEERKAVFRRTERQGAVLFPEVFVLHARVWLGFLLGREAEKALRERRERVVGVFGVAFHLERFEKLRRFEHHEHVVLGQHLFARGEGGELLSDVDALHVVDRRFYGDADVGLGEAEGGIGQDVERTRETEVARIVRAERNLDTALPVDHGGVFDEVAIERDGAVGGHGAEELRLQEADVVLIEVDFREHILQHRGENVARVDDFVHTVGAFALHDGLGRAQLLTINLL